MTKAKRNLIKCTVCAAFAAVICVLSPFAIPAAVPVTLATLGVYIAATSLPPSMSAAAVALYLAIGAIGAPVFSGFTGGVGRFVSPTGGYLAGYLPMALMISALVSLWRRGNKTDRDRKAKRPPFALDIAVRAACSVAGTVVLYALGTAWFAVSQKTAFAAALSTCVLPFLPGDAAKIVAAAIVSRALEPVIDRAMGRTSAKKSAKSR